MFICSGIISKIKNTKDKIYNYFCDLLIDQRINDMEEGKNMSPNVGLYSTIKSTISDLEYYKLELKNLRRRYYDLENKYTKQKLYLEAMKVDMNRIKINKICYEYNLEN